MAEGRAGHPGGRTAGLCGRGGPGGEWVSLNRESERGGPDNGGGLKCGDMVLRAHSFAHDITGG